MRTCTAYPASSVARRARVANVSQTAYAAHVHPLPPSRLHPSFCPRGKTEKDERPAGRVNKGPRTNGCKLKNGTTAASARLLFAESSRALSLSISYRLPFPILQPSFPFCCRHNLNLRRPDDTRETYVHRCHSILSPPSLPLLSSVSSPLPRGGFPPWRFSLEFLLRFEFFLPPSLDSFSRFLLSRDPYFPSTVLFLAAGRCGSHERDRSRRRRNLIVAPPGLMRK